MSKGNLAMFGSVAETAASYDTVASMCLDVGFMNFGYCGPEETLAGEDYCARLYREVLAGLIPGRDVLEVGCGRGGGCAWLAGHHPESRVLGLDISAGNIRLDRERYRLGNLTFEVGNAVDLHLPDESFDLVVNVESSHSYPSSVDFYREVHRVLRPGGNFAYADFFKTPDEHRKQLEEAGFESRLWTDITEGVLRALRRDSCRRRTLIEESVPTGSREEFLDFAAVEGSTNYDHLSNRVVEYWLYQGVKAVR